MPSPPATTTDEATALLTAADLGFRPLEDNSLAWTKSLGGDTVLFRILRRLPELVPVERLQQAVMGSTDLDTMAAGEMVVVAETGGDVIGAFAGEELIGAVIGLGGYVDRRPRIVSDLMVVRADLRSRGLGAELKKLQVAIALARGFVEIVWTVDPLRAANARLNIEKLGATSNRYEVNRYGEGYGTGLYGGLPTDRLHMTWSIASPAVCDRLLGRVPPLTAADVADLDRFDPQRPGIERALVHLPGAIDELLERDPAEALRWRLSLRDALQRAFAAGYAITGFVPAIDPERGVSAYVVSRRAIGDFGMMRSRPGGKRR